MATSHNNDDNCSIRGGCNSDEAVKVFLQQDDHEEFDVLEFWYVEQPNVLKPVP